MDDIKINKEIANWVENNFRAETRATITLGIAEEAGEVCRAVLKQQQGIRGTYEEWDEEIKKELADVYIKLVHLASFIGWDLSKLIETRWIEIQKRDWIKNPTGHGIEKYDYETEGLGGT